MAPPPLRKNCRDLETHGIERSVEIDGVHATPRLQRTFVQRDARHGNGCTIHGELQTAEYFDDMIDRVLDCRRLADVDHHGFGGVANSTKLFRQGLRPVKVDICNSNASTCRSELAGGLRAYSRGRARYKHHLAVKHLLHRHLEPRKFECDYLVVPALPPA